MDSFLQLLPWLMAMALLMACSGFFSASEAALFYLPPRDRRAMRSGTESEQAAVILLGDAERLLSAVLFWNLVINITYFAIASICSIWIEQNTSWGQTGAVVFAAVSLLSIIFFSEMLPKSIGVLTPRALARAVSFPLAMTVRLVDPLMPWCGDLWMICSSRSSSDRPRRTKRINMLPWRGPTSGSWGICRPLKR